MDSSTPAQARADLRRAMGFIAPYRGTIGFILLLTLLLGGASAIEPLVMRSIFEALGRSRNERLLASPLMLLCALGIAREAMNAISNWLTWRTRLRVHHRLLEVTVERLHVLPVSFHRSERVGALMTRLDRGIQGFASAITEAAFQTLPAIVYFVMALVIMVRLEWRLALVVVLCAPLPALIATRVAPSQTKRERLLLEQWARIYSRFNEVLSGIVTVKSFVMEDEEKRRFLQDVDRANRLVVNGVRFDSLSGAGQNVLILIGRCLSLSLGAFFVLRGQISIGTLVAFLGFVAGLFAPMQGLSSSYRTLRTATASIRTVFSILDTEDHLCDAEDALELRSPRGAVSFEGVHFQYPGKSTPLLKGLNLDVTPGEMLAIVGPSGAGKSTLMALLQRFDDPQEGVIRIDGYDLRRVRQHSLRRSIGVVLQDALLFDDTILNNIAYGWTEASPGKIEAAARAAHAHDFITRLPIGYSTFVGERGCRPVSASGSPLRERF
jgi:ATP-binding cassette subfamily B protein